VVWLRLAAAALGSSSSGLTQQFYWVSSHKEEHVGSGLPAVRPVLWIRASRVVYLDWLQSGYGSGSTTLRTGIRNLRFASGFACELGLNHQRRRHQTIINEYKKTTSLQGMYQKLFK
jgi:hypothetical protein